MAGIGLTIKRLSNEIYRFLNLYIKENFPDERSTTQTFFVHYIGKTNQPIYQKDLEKQFNIRRSTATEILQHMEKAGLIIRHVSTADARHKIIKLTDEGETYFNETALVFQKVNQLLSCNISESDLEIFFSVIDQIHDNMQRREPDDKNFIE